jgi:carboxymethylenebutenolidase
MRLILAHRAIASAGCLLVALAGCGGEGGSGGNTQAQPVQVSFPSGSLTLGGFLWKPSGPGPFPMVVYNHGSEQQPGSKPAVGQFFSSRGYVLFVPHRRGQGLSQAAGPWIQDVINAAPPNQQAQVRVDQLLLQVDDVAAAVAYMKLQAFVDTAKMAVAGCSYGGIETVFTAERSLGLRSAVDFAGAAQTWATDPPLQARMTTSVDNATVPIFFLQAANDYNTQPTQVLSAEMQSVNKPHQAKIYPPYGTTPDDGHAGFCFDGTAVWGDDVANFIASNQ